MIIEQISITGLPIYLCNYSCSRINFRAFLYEGVINLSLFSSIFTSLFTPSLSMSHVILNNMGAFFGIVGMGFESKSSSAASASVMA